jgi:ribonuclease VapC
VAILDASALLAHLRDEPGAQVVGDAIAEGAAISAVNLAETLSRAAGRGADPSELVERLTRAGLLDGAVVVEPFTAEDAIDVAHLRPLTRDAGLSLGDRACLALARRLGVPALTADTSWLGIERLGVELVQIR